MSTKEEILELLTERQGDYYSGEEIARRLSVSRAAVCKAVRNLRNEGYAIDGVTRRGYSLSDGIDPLSIRGIRGRLRPELQILKDDAVKVLHSICQQIWKTQQWPQD